MEEAIAFFMGSLPNNTKAGIIKNPPPAPTIPVNMPSAKPTNMSVSPYTGNTPSSSFLFFPKIMDNAETNIKLAKNNMIKLLLVKTLFPKCNKEGIPGKINFREIKTPMTEGPPKTKIVLISTKPCLSLEMTPAILLNPTTHSE